ncbi:MAG: S41 family peptidase [Anaerolineae bacterium]|nr:S41 family peptidase [Anaerolineae bacterium]MDW8101402.1 S41 family peptidase [Anaerolineae bacterium]
MKFLRILMVAFLSALAVTASFLTGMGIGMYQVSAPAVTPAVAPAREGEKFDFSVFWEAWEILEKEFYGEVPSPQERMYSAIKGVILSLGDPYTSFLDPKHASLAREDIKGTFEGIGAIVDMREGRLVIVEVIEGQPAEKAGLKSGDIILKVDDKPIENMSLLEAVLLIRGPKGTPVKLTVHREGLEEPFEVTIIRQRIEIPTLSYKMLEGGIAYIKLREFNEIAPRKLKEALKELMPKNPRGIILDLRGNPGGLLSAAVEVASQFVDQSPILIERLKSGEQKLFKPVRGGLATDPRIPMVVLINGASASASEIVAGAIRDHKRGILIGEKTLGKGSVQQPFTLKDGSELRVTIARWFTPSGQAIHGEGLIPDIEVKAGEEGQDPQLEKAVEYLLTLRR